jgi:hypothetical protein
MKYFKSILLIAAFFTAGMVSCIKKPTQNELETALMDAMSHDLNSNPNLDTSKVKFTVISVDYFEEKTFYACEFKVRMKTSNTDTTGIMAANVNKDLEHVVRKN